MRIDQKGSRKKIIIGVVAAVLVGAGLTFFMLGGVEKVRAAFQPKDQKHSVMLTGKLLCLPRQDGGETSVLSCALGMKTDDGKYYGLSGSKNTELSESAGSDKKVKLSGELQTSSDSTYKMNGIVAVSSFDFN
jgi:flagellar basal body-associated protein FliL